MVHRLCSVTWTELERVQRSFSAKAVALLPLVAFGIAILPERWAELYLLANWRLHVVFWGAMSFLIGMIVVSFFRPVEFSTGLDVTTEVAQMQMTATYQNFDDRRRMLSQLITRYTNGAPLGLRVTIFEAAKQHLAAANAATEETWRVYFPSLIIFHRRLRDLDAPVSRISAAMLLLLGVLLMLAPVAYNIAVASYVLLAGYFRSVAAIFFGLVMAV